MTPIPQPGDRVRITQGTLTGAHGTVIPNVQNDEPGWRLVKLGSDCSVRLFPTDWLEYEVPEVAEADMSPIVITRAARLPPATDKLDALIAAFRAFGPDLDRVSLSYHAGWLHVSVASPDATGADGVGRLCAEIGASEPELAECDSYTWLRSTSKRKPDVSVSITGDWLVKP